MDEDRGHLHMSTDRRLDKHEDHISQMSDTITEIKNMMRQTNESQIALSEAVVKMSTQLEMLTNLTRTSEENSQRLYKEEKATALMFQQLERLPEISNKIDYTNSVTNQRVDSMQTEMNTIKESQTHNKLVVAVIVFISGVVASGITLGIINMLFGLFT